MRFMSSTLRFFFYLIFVCFLYSCSEKQKHSDSTYSVFRMDFSDELILDGTVEAINSSYISCPDIYNSIIVYLVEDGSMVEAGDTVCILENQQLIDRLETVQRLYELYQAEYNKGVADLEMNYAMLQAQVRNNETQMAISSLDSLQLQYYTTSQRKIAEIRLEMSRIESRKLKKKLEALETINRSELRTLKLYTMQAERLLQSTKDALKQLILISPKSGMALRAESEITDGKIQEGEEAYPKKPLIIIPESELVQVRIQASETAYKRISLGQKVEYSFDGMPGNYAYGSIAMKSPRGYPMSRKSKVKIFDIVASVDSSRQIPGAGLSANCRVYLNYLSDTIAVPFIAVFQEDSINVVYVKKGSSFVRQEVGIALQSSKEAVIACGLEGGEEIAMLKPQKSQIKGEVLLDCEQRTRYTPRNNDSIPEEFLALPEEVQAEFPSSGSMENEVVPEDYEPFK